MIAALYQYIYLLLVTILTAVSVSRYRNVSGIGNYAEKGGEAANVILVLLLTVFIGVRPISGIYFGDTINYANYYLSYLDGSPFSFTWENDPVFANWFAWVGSKRLGLTFFFTTIAAVYFGAAYLGIRKLFPNNKLAAYLVFLAAFSTYSYATNGIRAGAAASLFICAMGYRKKLLVCIPLILISWGVHHSMQLPVVAFLLTLFFKNPRWYYYGWMFCLLMAFAHVGFFADLFAGFTDETGANYLMSRSQSDSDYGGRGGFRIDFVLYSAAPVIIGYYTEIKKKVRIPALYGDLMHMYLCINGVWMLCMYATFTNRIAYLSWFLYPIVLVYPFLNGAWGAKRYRIFSKAMTYQLLFTLFMELVYYGFLR